MDLVKELVNKQPDSGQITISDLELRQSKLFDLKSLQRDMMAFALEHPDYTIAIENPVELPGKQRGVRITWRQNVNRTDASLPFQNVRS